MASTTPFTYKSFPVCPGAYLVNSSYGAHPIFCSIANLPNIGCNDIDDKYIIMPGYKLTVYKDYYSNSPYDVTNTTGTIVKVQSATYPNAATSCKLYYKDIEIFITGIS
jgi:hypothetical protein